MLATQLARRPSALDQQLGTQTGSDWTFAALVGAFGAIAAFPLYPNGNPIAFIGVWATLFPFIAGVAFNARLPAIPLFAVSMFGVQHVVCPMFYYGNQELIGYSFGITDSFETYFPLACRASFVLSAVTSLAVAGPLSRVEMPAPLPHPLQAQLLRWSWIVWGGASAASILLPKFPITSLAYVWTLALGLGEVALVVLVLYTPLNTCRVFLVAVTAVQGLKALRSTMVSELGITLAIALIFYAHRQRWRFRLLAVLLVAAFVLTAVQTEKLEYRKRIWNQTGLSTLSEQLDFWGTRMQDRLARPQQIFAIEGAWPLIERLNQGKLVERIVDVVPAYVEPAKGETIKTAFRLLMPRLLWKQKPSRYSLEVFERYTMHRLQPGTSMGVGPLGECYLNFTSYALAAFFVYALSVGIISRKWTLLGVTQPLWWAWFSFFFLYWFKFESDFAKGVNAIFKSGMFFIAMLYVSPVWRKTLGIGRPPGILKPSRPTPGAPRRPVQSMGP